MHSGYLVKIFSLINYVSKFTLRGYFHLNVLVITGLSHFLSFIRWVFCFLEVHNPFSLFTSFLSFSRDFDQDDYLGKEDLKQTLRAITAKELTDEEMEFVSDEVLYSKFHALLANFKSINQFISLPKNVLRPKRRMKCFQSKPSFANL